MDVARYVDKADKLDGVAMLFLLFFPQCVTLPFPDFLYYMQGGGLWQR